VLNVGGSIPDKSKLPQSDYGYNMDLLAPAGAVDGCDTGWTLNYSSQAPVPGAFSFNGFAGTSASTSNVAGCAALLRSHFLRLDPAHSKYLEPEDYAGILKASAWRYDLDRIAHSAINFWRPLSGWGHLDIGKAFQMLDPDTTAYPYSGYEIRHYSDGFDSTTFQVGPWTPSDSVEYFFNVPWRAGGQNPKYGERTYLLDTATISAYFVKLRTISKTDTLNDIWDITDTSHQSRKSLVVTHSSSFELIREATPFRLAFI
jgi:subtilisin family serine protease